MSDWFVTERMQRFTARNWFWSPSRWWSDDSTKCLRRGSSTSDRLQRRKGVRSNLRQCRRIWSPSAVL